MFSSDRCLIIGEVAQAHDGSLGMAHAYIDAVAKAGADAVKFQTHFAVEESSADEPFRIRFTTQDATRFDYWKRLEFTDGQWAELAAHAAERGLLFLSSPFSGRALDLLQRLGVPAWKIASGEISNRPLLSRLAATGKPIILSTGMSPLTEIDEAVEFFRGRGNELAVLQCTTSYPCPPEKVGLNVLEVFRQRYDGIPVGLSDHSGTIFPGLAAATMGASVLEVHVTFSRDMFGPDVPASVTFEDLRLMVDGIRFIERMRANPVAKDDVAGDLSPLRAMFMKSLAAARPISAGEVLQPSDIRILKPAKGIPAADFDQAVGRRLRRSVEEGEFLQFDDLD
ncbi:N-acetylneuraminate synthase family protein [Arenibaculum sp.]|jgi:N-acetylneuraminate synthase|uniref:N-acetylneuraminate synthase family protein n=1 Tax=Arenibaculum sp. TaxID=2865862 RepID=UPI002E131034|nr:N-acetylneuraminate synthase family protein [Arenibaculum sp.]